jgi:Lsr2
MAQKIEVRYIDDLDGSEAKGTVTFGLDGADYEIDLNAKHEADLRKMFSKYTDHARKAAPVRSRRKQGDRQRTAAIRDWARAQGIEISNRGRVRKEVIARYEAKQ